ncbi:hypothetical protein DXU93_07815 [Brumimicrobium aurantiacum]|uniref:DUF5050 domain-containing protein n=2 Tax=Brumimicrobium aurantiacum TaxID=1737063 RepID=A0A3E1EXN9_9FLAO|nr:hypothetical protein DXU93_07815 [Brumimicrobium aurantiacum]
MLHSEPYPDSFVKLDTNFQHCVSSPMVYDLEEHRYTSPIVNPTNPFEFIFMRSNILQGGASYELCVYNFCTNNTKVITEDFAVNSYIDWSVKDWIVFRGENSDIYKVKSNGDSLTNLTNTVDLCGDPKWSPSGERLLYYDESNYEYSICNEDGSVIESFFVSMDSYDWLDEENLIYLKSMNSNIYLRKFNIQSNTHQDLTVLNNIATAEPIEVNGSTAFFTTSKGMYKYESNQTTLIDTNYFTYYSMNPQRLLGSKILTRRIIGDTTGMSECEYYYGSFLSILDEATGEERRVKIPE